VSGPVEMRGALSLERGRQGAVRWLSLPPSLWPGVVPPMVAPKCAYLCCGRAIKDRKHRLSELQGEEVGEGVFRADGVFVHSSCRHSHSRPPPALWYKRRVARVRKAPHTHTQTGGDKAYRSGSSLTVACCVVCVCVSSKDAPPLCARCG
jgi:hypothetical protein